MYHFDFLYKKNHKSLYVAFNQNKWDKKIKKKIKRNGEKKLPINGKE